MIEQQARDYFEIAPEKTCARQRLGSFAAGA